MDTQKEVKLNDIFIVREFSNIFPNELPRLPPDQVIDFEIDIMLRAGPISKIPYRMAPIDLQELKVQL